MFFIGLIGDAIVDAWFAVMQWIVPEKAMGKSIRIILKVIVGIISFLLFISIILGIFAVISDDPYTKQIGKYLIFIPLGISAVQIVFGIIVRAISRKNK